MCSKKSFIAVRKHLILVLLVLLLSCPLMARERTEVDFEADLWISEQPYNSTTMGSTIPPEFLQLLPHCPLSNSGQNDNPWPLSDQTYVNNGGAENSDWDLDVQNSEFIFYVTPKVTGEVNSFCAFNLTIQADSEAIQIFPPTEQKFIGSLFANEINTGFNHDDYDLDISTNPELNQFSIQVTPDEYSSAYNVTTDSTNSDYLFKFSSILKAPSSPEINSEIYGSLSKSAGKAIH